jgi:hypothetical protein
MDMGIRDRTLPAVVLFFCLAAAGARAEDTRYLRYEVYWGGLHAADFALTLHYDKGRYDHDFEMRSSGIAQWLLKLDVTARSQGRMEAPGVPLPEAYRTDFVNRWRNGMIGVRYGLGPDNQPLGTTVIDWSDPPRRNDDEDTLSGALDDETRAGALDPLAAITEAVHRSAAWLTTRQGEFRIRVFDGRRRFDFVGTPMTPVSMDVLGQRRVVQRLQLHTEPVAGFNDRMLSAWNGRVFEISLLPSAIPGGEPTPVRIEGDGLGPVINLTAECADRASCALPPRKAESPHPASATAGAG